MSNVSTTPTGTTTAVPASSSLARSTKFMTFAATFCVAGCVMYLICLFWNLPLVSYHPAVGRLDLGWTAARSGEGPAMYWYGWTLTTVLVAGVLGLIAAMLPDRIGRKIPLFLVWLVPIICIPFFIYSLMPFWTHQ